MQCRDPQPGHCLPANRPGVRRLTALLFGLLVGGSAGAFAEQAYYRWVDDAGNVVMSDRPPERGDIEYETIDIQRSRLRPSRTGSTPAAAAVEAPVLPAPTPREGIETQDAGPTVMAVQHDPEACEQARNNLEVLNMKPRIRVYNEQGELEYLTPAQIEEEKRKSLLTMEVHCEK